MLDGKRSGSGHAGAVQRRKNTLNYVRGLARIRRHQDSIRRRRSAQQLGIPAFAYDRNYGYGMNQQTCSGKALAVGAEIVVMVHHD
jgi:hypothetical protein